MELLNLTNRFSWGNLYIFSCLHCLLCQSHPLHSPYMQPLSPLLISLRFLTFLPPSPPLFQSTYLNTCVLQYTLCQFPVLSAPVLWYFISLFYIYLLPHFLTSPSSDIPMSCIPQYVPGCGVAAVCLSFAPSQEAGVGWS